MKGTLQYASKIKQNEAAHDAYILYRLDEMSKEKLNPQPVSRPPPLQYLASSINLSPRHIELLNASPSTKNRLSALEPHQNPKLSDVLLLI
jgi:hypothetical protein